MIRVRRIFSLIPLLLLITLIGSFSAGISDIQAQGPTKDPCRDDEGNEICPHYNSFDARVNYLDPMATITAYCRADRGLDVWIITNTQGQYAYTLSEAQLSNALGQAIATGQTVLIGDSLAMQVLALPANQLLLRDGRNGYEFSFSPALCGVTANPNYAPPPPTAAPTTEEPALQNVPSATSDVTVVIVPNGNLATATPTPTAMPETSNLLVSNITLNLRAGPGFTTKLLALIPIGTELTILGRSTDGSWLAVIFSGQQGWIWSPLTGLTSDVISGLDIALTS